MDFGSLITAMVTPFDKQGNIDFDVTTRLIEHLLSHGTEAIVVAGTTGESPTLTDDEKLALFNHVIEVTNRRVPVIAGTGNNHTKASIELTKKADELGADGIMLVTPYYNRPNQRGMIEHFSAIAQETRLPVMLYNIPSRSVVHMTAETVIRLSEIDNIVAIKDSSGDLDHLSEIIERTKEDFHVYSGDDGMTLPILSIGGKGVVSVASHIIGNEMKKIITTFQNGQNKEAAMLHRRYLPIIKSLFQAPSPAPVKAALSLKGIDVGSVRRPLVGLTDQELSALKGALQLN